MTRAERIEEILAGIYETLEYQVEDVGDLPDDHPLPIARRLAMLPVRQRSEETTRIMLDEITKFQDRYDIAAADLDGWYGCPLCWLYYQAYAALELIRDEKNGFDEAEAIHAMAA